MNFLKLACLTYKPKMVKKIILLNKIYLFTQISDIRQKFYFNLKFFEFTRT